MFWALDAHGVPWAPHGRPMGAPCAPHGRPWAPRGAPWAPHVLFLHGKTTKNIKNGLNGVEVAPFGLSLGRNGVPGGAEPLGLLPRPILGLFWGGGSALGALGPRAPGRCAAGCAKRSLHWFSGQKASPLAVWAAGGGGRSRQLKPHWCKPTHTQNRYPALRGNRSGTSCTSHLGSLGCAQGDLWGPWGEIPHGPQGA